MITQVFLDVDGVLADFTGHALRLLDRRDLLEHYPAGEYSLAKITGIPDEVLWDKLDNDVFWRTVPPFRGVGVFLRNLDEFCRDHAAALVYCTVGTRYKYFTAARAKWLQRLNAAVGLGLPFILLPTWEGKGLLAAPGRLFIDDNLLILKAVEAQGGIAVRVPQPWNCDSVSDVTDPDYDSIMKSIRKEFKYDLYRSLGSVQTDSCSFCRNRTKDCVASASVDSNGVDDGFRVYFRS